MKTIQKTQLSFLLCSLWMMGMGGGCQPSAPESDEPTSTQFILGCSPFFDREHKEELYRSIVKFFLEDVPIGSSLHVYDAYHMRAVMKIDIPRRQAFTSARTRLNQYGRELRSLRSFLAKDHVSPSAEGLEFTETIRWPQFLALVGDHLVSTNAGASILMAGSPLYRDEKEPKFSMVDGYFPSDAHLLATGERTVYGTADSLPRLRQARVHVVYGSDPWLDDVHQNKVERFWGHFVARLGGTLGTFSGDPRTAFQAWAHSEDTLQVSRQLAPIDRTLTKIEMLRVRRSVGLTDWITKEMDSSFPPPPPRSEFGPMKIGIRWNDDVDFDLYARPSSHRPILFFDHPRTTEGYYFKDHRSSPGREFEFIEFISSVHPREVEAYVNLYDGHLPEGSRGEVRVEFDGQIFARPFTIRAKEGNLGRRGPGEENCWARIDIPQLLGLAPERVAARVP